MQGMSKEEQKEDRDRTTKREVSRELEVKSCLFCKKEFTGIHQNQDGKDVRGVCGTCCMFLSSPKEFYSVTYDDEMLPVSETLYRD